MSSDVVSQKPSVSAENPANTTEAIVKWFSRTKGFGFCAPADGSSDAFIHSSVLSHSGMDNLAEGTKIIVELGNGEKGRQVLNILQVLEVVPMQRASTRAAATGPAVEMTGTVKWFKVDKGFGFVEPDGGGRDIFIHRSIIDDAGIPIPQTGQKVKMTVHSASKGLEASSIALIDE